MQLLLGRKWRKRKVNCEAVMRDVTICAYKKHAKDQQKKYCFFPHTVYILVRGTDVSKTQNF